MAKKYVRIPEIECVKCGHKLTAATEARGRKVVPKKGDMTICVYCKALLKFIEGGKVVGVTVEEVEKMRVENPQEYADIYVAAIKADQKLQELRGGYN